MLFTDSLFLFYFLPAALFILFLAHKWSGKQRYSNLSKAMLFCLTVAFYGCQEVWWLLPFGICVVFDFLWGSWLFRVRKPWLRRSILALSLFQSLSLLALFKYWPFLRQNLIGVFPSLSHWLPQILMDGKAILLPAGISFYTFESMSFVIDIYRREITPPKNPLDFAAFIAMFPRFVAGPIVRYGEITRQFTAHSGLKLEKGLFLFFWGFALKTVFADAFAIFANYAFSGEGGLGFWSAWVGIFSYTLQIYFDFSGYSLMAIGLGWCLGFEFPDNFRRPYLASTLKDFWQRWHISLSRWLRDYLYIPLGGNQKGSFRTYLNLFLTMTLGGLWHGAGWTFIAWGAWHGLWLGLERAFPRLLAAGTWGRVRTLTVIMVGWVFFRSKDFNQASDVLSAMANPFKGIASFNTAGIEAHSFSFFCCVLGVVYCFGLEPKLTYDLPDTQRVVSFFERALLGVVFLISLVLGYSSTVIPFLYFQF